MTAPIAELKSISAADLLSQKFPSREHIVAPWFRTGETALIWAGTGVGKTMLTLSLALAIAGGGKVDTWEASRPRKVLVVDGEMHLQDLAERLRMLIESGAVQGVDPEVAGRNLTIVARQAQDPESTFFDITEEESQNEIYRRCHKGSFEVLIVDNLTTVADSLDDENEATSFRKVQSFLLKMKQAGIATVLVHHARKDGQEPRGSTALMTTFEVILGLVKPQVSPAGTAAFITRFTKFRAKGDSSIRPHCWTLGETGWSVEEDMEDSLEGTLRAFSSLNYVSQQEIAEALGVTKGAISKRIARLVAEQRTTKEALREYLEKAKGLREGNGGEPLDIDPDDDKDVPF